MAITDLTVKDLMKLTVDDLYSLLTSKPAEVPFESVLERGEVEAQLRDGIRFRHSDRDLNDPALRAWRVEGESQAVPCETPSGELPTVPAMSGAAKTRSAGEVFVNALGMTFVWVAPGAFHREKPSHRVTLTSGYFISARPVTNEQWRKVMGKELDERVRWPHHYVSHLTFGQGIDVGTAWPENRVHYVSWFDCQAFVEKLRQIDSWRYSLPTEAQWELASEAGSAVGLQLYPMLKEWCQDWFDSHPQSDVSDPLGPDRSPMGARVMRSQEGGRTFMGPQWRDEHHGFRVVLLSDV